MDRPAWARAPEPEATQPLPPAEASAVLHDLLALVDHLPTDGVDRRAPVPPFPHAWRERPS